MRERLVEDWLSRINERGYDVAFCQTLIAKGQRILRSGHSPTEHGKDVISRSATDAQVWAYQLKTGNFSQADLLKHHDQLKMLVETRPILPGLPENFTYHPVLVTTGEFKEPAVSLIKEFNAGWRSRGLPELQFMGGRELLADLLALSDDFWPVAGPAVHDLRSLYLVDGQGDFDPINFGSFMQRLIGSSAAAKDLGRQAAATNLFASYLLGEFYQSGDHWSVFRGWTICAAAIAGAGESAGDSRARWQEPFNLAQTAAFAALRALTEEARDENAFRSGAMELDEYTRVRNLTAMSAAACGLITAEILGELIPDTGSLLKRMEDFATRGRFLFWGEGALSQYVMVVWALERAGRGAAAQSLLSEALRLASTKNHPESKDPLPDPYQSPDACLMAMLAETNDAKRSSAIESYTLYPLVLLCVRRQMRIELAANWPQITRVRLTWFRTEEPADVLRWTCERGREYTTQFESPQNWKDLAAIAARQDRDRLPSVLWDNRAFALMYLLTYQHRMLASLYKRLDDVLAPAGSHG
ncbi:MAG: hypothetical protein PHE83_05400 [Opitutaceae bacterium]|nr:hypothetical protein [Opitutaceae bacterium]